MGEIFNTIIVNPTVNLLLLFHFIFARLHIPGALGWSLISLTIIIRVFLHPFYKQQMDLTKKMADMKPQLDEIQKKYKNDKQKLQQAQLALYKEKGINPAGGCLVGLLQLPFILGLYNALLTILKGGSMTHVVATINKIAYTGFLQVSAIDPVFFGFNLAKTPSQFQTLGWYYLLIPVITGALQYVQGQYMMPATPKALKVDKKDDKSGSPDMSAMMSTQMKIMFPLMVGYFSYILPLGLSIYWNVFSIFSVLQYRAKQK